MNVVAPPTLSVAVVVNPLRVALAAVSALAIVALFSRERPGHVGAMRRRKRIGDVRAVGLESAGNLRARRRDVTREMLPQTPARLESTRPSLRTYEPPSPGASGKIGTAGPSGCGPGDGPPSGTGASCATPSWLTWNMNTGGVTSRPVRRPPA